MIVQGGLSLPHKKGFSADTNQKAQHPKNKNFGKKWLARQCKLYITMDKL
jgi:hypothetical protein